jgi:hypothetical protein
VDPERSFVGFIRLAYRPFHWDIDPARMMRPRFADSIRASSPSGLREQAGHMTASDFCAARYIFSCQAGAIHT